MRTSLFRRREVWLPTVWGALLLLALGAALLFGLARAAAPWLAPHAPAPGARTLVVEGWLDLAEIRQAAQVARAGRYARVLTTGGPIDPLVDAAGHRSFALRAAALLRANGLTELPVIAVPAPASAQERSYLSAVVLREWAKRNDPALAAFDLYSAGVHARRSWLVYRMAFGARVEVGILAARPTDYDPQRWWASSIGAKATLGEAIGLAWTTCCFWPGPPGSHDERWGVPAAAGTVP
ncbi:MAG TPA: hypothetical protein VFA35_07750 [Burkholderiaceae bacterium]|nr:hypothetical protein [Burkholderiaceae bacterium]